MASLNHVERKHIGAVLLLQQNVHHVTHNMGAWPHGEQPYSKRHLAVVNNEIFATAPQHYPQPYSCSSPAEGDAALRRIAALQRQLIHIYIYSW